MRFSCIAQTLGAACGLASAYQYSNETVTTLAPSTETAALTETIEYTSDGSDITSTVTLLTTITLSGNSAISSGAAPSAAVVTVDAGNNKGAGAVSASSELTSTSEVWSTITSTLYTTEYFTLSNSQVSQTVSAYEKQIIVGTSVPSCTPQTVTVTQQETQTQYVTVTAGPSSAYWSPSSAAFYNSTSIQN
ncbi:LADA_0C06590g1_1 [Lachancea dasiensis]|uniref:LADA_0C06590g1_1 n=1 Tax=Lachancea dasiensis TaxID=1072105 RepID=A0A1G4IZF9_9SACH|nr:LADA_0C06590g1_1 [Lachancea dasiensis]